MSTKIGDELSIAIGGYTLTGITATVTEITMGAVYATVTDFDTTQKITFALPLKIEEYGRGT